MVLLLSNFIIVGFSSMYYPSLFTSKCLKWLLYFTFITMVVENVGLLRFFLNFLLFFKCQNMQTYALKTLSIWLYMLWNVLCTYKVSDKVNHEKYANVWKSLLYLSTFVTIKWPMV